MLRKGLNPLVTTLSTAQSAPVVAEMRLRAGKTGSGRGAASQLRSAITTAKACGASGKIMVRGDSAFGNKAVIGASIRSGIEFSLAMTRNPRITRAIESIDEQAWTPVHYPGAVTDPDTGQLISDAEVAEVEYTAFSGRHQVTARLVVRRVKDANYPEALFPVWVPPVFHQFRSADRRRGPDPPQACDPGNGVRGSDRRAAGAYPVGSVSGELCLGDLRGDRAQPAPCRGHRRRRHSCRRSRCHVAPELGERSGPIRAPCWQTCAPFARPLAVAETVEHPVVQGYRYSTRATTIGLTYPFRRPRPYLEDLRQRG